MSISFIEMLGELSHSVRERGPLPNLSEAFMKIDIFKEQVNNNSVTSSKWRWITVDKENT